jgi:hypothetical protein
MSDQARREYKTRWARENPEGHVAWCAANRQKVRAYKRKWKQTHPEAHLASKRRWRARRSGEMR